MPRKKYERRIVPYMVAYPKLNADQTFESMKKEASRFVGVLEKWMQKQRTNADDYEVEYYEESLFPGIDKAKTYRSRIYTANKKMAQIDVDSEMARLAGDETKLAELKDSKNELEEDVAGYCWRIYRIYSFIRPQIQLGELDTRDEEYSEFEARPDSA